MPPFLMLERFPKSVKRFLDKKRDNQRNLEHHFDSIEMGYALAQYFGIINAIFI